MEVSALFMLCFMSSMYRPSVAWYLVLRGVSFRLPCDLQSFRSTQRFACDEQERFAPNHSRAG